MVSNDNKLYILGQGSYGCVYNPEITCRDKKTDGKRYVSKVQLDDYLSGQEVNIGKIIKKIPSYMLRYGPIINTCPLNYAKITETELSACKMHVKNKSTQSEKKFISSKMRYIGKYTLGAFLKNMILGAEGSNEQNVRQYMNHLAEIHLYLLASIRELYAYGLIHLDLNNRNILYDDKHKVPIVIDFGLSVVTKTLDISVYKENAKHPFGVKAPFYYSWCIEILMLSHIATEIGSARPYTVNKKLLETKISSEYISKTLKKICDNYVDGLQAYSKQMIFTKDEMENMRTRLYEWVGGFVDKTWSEVWTELVKTNSSWDNYSLSVMFLMELLISGLLPRDMLKEENDLFHKYAGALKKIVLSDPSSRELPEATAIQMTKLFKNVDSQSYTKAITKYNESGKDINKKIQTAYQHSEKVVINKQNVMVDARREMVVA